MTGYAGFLCLGKMNDLVQTQCALVVFATPTWGLFMLPTAMFI